MYYNVITEEEFKEILRLHQLYLEGNEEGECADLDNVDLAGWDLKNVDLREAMMHYVNLSCADLRGANLKGAHLRGADLNGTMLDKEEECRRGVILNEALIGYTKCVTKDEHEDIIVKVEVPKGAIVFGIDNYEFRTNKCKILEIEGHDVAYGYVGQHKTLFKVNKKVNVQDFDLMYNELGSAYHNSGVHFFKTRQEAIDYNM